MYPSLPLQRFAPLPSIGTSVPSPITLSPSALPTHMSICGQSLEASRLSSPHPPLSPHPPSGTPHGRTMHAQRKHKFRAKTNHSTASPITLPSHPSPPHTLPSHPSPPHTLPPHPSPHHTLTSHPSLPHTLPSYPSPPHTLPAPHISLPPEPSADNPLSVLLCIKLPSGGRAQRRFLTSDRLSAVLLFSVQQECDSEVGGVSSEWELSTSEVPKRTLHDTSVTLEGSGLSVNSLLHLSERSGCGDGWLPKQVSV